MAVLNNRSTLCKKKHNDSMDTPFVSLCYVSMLSVLQIMVSVLSLSSLIHVEIMKFNSYLPTLLKVERSAKNIHDHNMYSTHGAGSSLAMTAGRYCRTNSLLITYDRT